MSAIRVPIKCKFCGFRLQKFRITADFVEYRCLQCGKPEKVEIPAEIDEKLEKASTEDLTPPA